MIVACNRLDPNISDFIGNNEWLQIGGITLYFYPAKMVVFNGCENRDWEGYRKEKTY